MTAILIRKEALRDAICYLRLDPRGADRFRNCLNRFSRKELELILEGKQPFPEQFCNCHRLAALLAYYLTDRARYHVLNDIKGLADSAELHEHAKLALGAVLGDEPGKTPIQASISSM